MLWRTGSFHNLELLAMQRSGQMLDPTRFAIVAAGEYVWTLGRDVKDPNPMAPSRWRAGEPTAARSSGSRATWPITPCSTWSGRPILAEGKLFMRGQEPAEPASSNQGQPQQFGPGDPAP